MGVHQGSSGPFSGQSCNTTRKACPSHRQLDFGAVLVVVRYQLGQRSLGVNPTADVYEHDELRSPIAEDRQVRRDATSDQAAQQGSLRGAAHVPLV